MNAILSYLVPEPQMEEGTGIPVAKPVDSTPDSSCESNRFVPVAPTSALSPPLSTLEEEEEQRPDLLSATVYKSLRDTPIGIVLKDSIIVGVSVKSVEPDGLFGASGFQAGDQLMSVNSESCKGLDSKGVADLIRKAEDILTVVVRASNGRADRVSSMVMKKSPEARVGIGFRKRGEELVISSIAEDGIFAHSLLNVSDTCLSINGVACTSDTDATTAARLVQTSPSFVTIMAMTKHSTGVVVAASKSWGTYVGGSGPATATRGRQGGPITVAQKKRIHVGLCCAFFVIIFAIFVIVIFLRGLFS